MGEFRRFEFQSSAFTIVSDGTSAFPAEFLLIGVPESEREAACRRWNFDPRQVPSSINCLYITIDGRSILFDSGAGHTLPGCGKLPESLEAAGIALADINVVIHTHAHLDHLGWNVDPDGGPMFPNATYMIGETELAFWSDDATHEALNRSELWRLPDFEPAMSSVVKSNLLALDDRLESFPDDGQPVPGVQAIPAFGHTPGHLAFEIDLGSDRLLVTGDLALNPMHIERSDWYSGVDLEPDTALASRARLFDYAAEANIMMAGYHMPFPGIGRLAKTESGWSWAAVG